MKKSQIELSMLTRFAMVFFIMSLAVIMLLFSRSEQKGLCQTQAELAARQIASSINQVLTSPAEDERKVIPLIAALSVGEQERARYEVQITNRQDSKTLVVGVVTGSPDCQSFQSVGYGTSSLVFQPSQALPAGASADAHLYQEHFGTVDYNALRLTPSNPSDRSSFLIVLKCQQKTFGGQKFLYLQNCNYVFRGATSVNPDLCIRLSSFETECGFNH